MNASPEALAQLEREYGLDKPAVVQYADWLTSAVRGDLGTSLLTGADIADEIATKATVTLPLIALASVFALLIALPVGMLSALRHRKLDGFALNTTSQLGIAVPTFWMGVMLISLFALRTSLFPAGGFPDEGWSAWAECLRSLALPAITLGLAQGAVLARFARCNRTTFAPRVRRGYHAQRLCTYMAFVTHSFLLSRYLVCRYRR
jgi:peptide/nickel transport system permease protein